MARDSAAGGVMMRFLLAAVLLLAVSAVAEADERQTFNDYLKAAEGGDVHAQARVGLLYEQGKGTPQDDALAFAWFRKAAEGGNVLAQDKVGFLYLAGKGTPQDDGEAMRWFSRAAERGHSVSQFALGGMYEDGLGVTKDSIQAHKWYSLAAASATNPQFREGAAKSRDRVAQAMTPEQIAEAQRLAREWKPTAGPVEAPHPSGSRAAAPGQPAPRIIPFNEALPALQKANPGFSVEELRRAYINRYGSLNPSGARGAAPSAPAPVAPDADRSQQAGASELAPSGTGFIVSRQGHVLTNFHVIKGCRSVRATVGGHSKPVTIVGTDVENDLVLLQLTPPVPGVAHFRESRTIRSGDGVVVVGFPLPGLLASEANVTTGTVSALAGIGNNTRFLQITAPVQPGDSGAPLLDQSGNVVGVVVSKLNALAIANATGDIPQNINFAIKGAIAKAFLDSQSVEYETGASSRRREASAIGAAGKRFTLRLGCYTEETGADLDAERKALAAERRALAEERLQVKEETFRRMQSVMLLTKKHPDWQEIVGPPGSGTAYRKWLATQPEEYQRLINESWDPEVIGQSIDRFKAAQRSVR